MVEGKLFVPFLSLFLSPFFLSLLFFLPPSCLPIHHSVSSIQCSYPPVFDREKRMEKSSLFSSNSILFLLFSVHIHLCLMVKGKLFSILFFCPPSLIVLLFFQLLQIQLFAYLMPFLPVFRFWFIFSRSPFVCISPFMLIPSFLFVLFPFHLSG